MTIDQNAPDELLDLLIDLLAVPGPSGQEAEIAGRVEMELRRAGAADGQLATDLAHQYSPCQGQVGNLCLQLPGTCPGPRRLLVAHLDTVPICVGCQPLLDGPTIRSADPATGLGADNRAGTAVLTWTAIRLLRERPRHPPLTLLWTVQEEIGLQGARLLDPKFLGHPVYGFNWDGGAPEKLTIGATGGYRMQIDVQGKASHAGNCPQAGISAIAVAALAIAELHQSGWHGQINKDGQSGTSNLGVISGGQATNVVTDHVRLHGEARSHDPAFRQTIVQRIREAFERAAANVRSETGETARVDFVGRLDYESFCLPTDHPAIAEARRAVEAAGRQAELAIANGGLDANWLTHHGIPTVSFGCGQRGQHTVSESMSVPDFLAACEIAWQVACGQQADAAADRR